ncbi:hypothetical protein TIFTF001_041181 [Ficus carica]|uniref:Uncharacterized protein n=1 Tax=Ficus carica TaxID=3494 RepID=A0AA87Z927_FICCA|nr:hypothetical protein TIFTF001_041181 [Ficus carica]
MVNLHAIDTRGTVDALGCLECRCDLYNVTKNADGQPLPKGYIGGLDCCYDQTQCQVKKGFYGARRGLYLKYTVEWADWSDFILPVWIYIFDVTDTWTGLKSAEHNCLVEYDVLKSNKTTSNDSIETKKNYATISTGKYLIYGVAHQHTGGIGATVYGQAVFGDVYTFKLEDIDGRVICSSTAIYGNGTEAGNEAGYIVGMSTCYPKPGSIKILAGERLVHESRYHNNKTHTGVMGLFYILVADKLPN